MDSTDKQPQASAGLFELLVQSVTDYAIYMLDTGGHVTSWNPGAQRFKGYREEEILGHHFSRFYTDEDRAAGVPQRALQTARDEGRFEAEGWRVRKDGSRFWANVVIDPVRDSTGTLVGFAKVTRDLTERREAQKALEQAQEAFFQSQKMDAIGKLTGGVAHDFNNLLAVVIGSLDIARRRVPKGADIGRFLDNAMMAAERGAALTQRMLAFARRQELQMETVDVAGLVRGMADLLQRTLGAGVGIDTRFPLILNKVCADPRQLELALLNLAVNARDAMPQGGQIVISARDESMGEGSGAKLPAGDYVCIAVTDRGEGMDEETLARAMEPFFTTKGIGKGTGLGLSMVHGFAEQSGGALLLRSKPGEGTTAEIWLPAAEPEAQPQPEPVKLEAVPDPVGPFTVLTVDDDNLVLTNTSAVLEELGHEVVQASSGMEALRILDAREVDLVLTDYAMPGMTGAQLAETVRRTWPSLPILLVTGFAEVPPGVADDLPRLTKPFRPEELARAMAALMPENPKHLRQAGNGGRAA